MDRKQRGTVLITVVMMVAIAALIVTDMSYRQKLDIKRTAALLSRDQAFHYLMGAEEIANWTLVDDLKRDNKGSNPLIIDTLGEPWAKETQPFPVAGGLIQGRIIDLQGRFNINSLMASDAAIALKQKERLRLLMDRRSIPTDSDSTISTQMLIERIVDWMDTDQDPTGLDGREDIDYLAMDIPHRTANRIMWDISELMLIEGFTPDDVAALADYVCFLPPDAALNVNTADAIVLDAYSFGITGAQIVEDREKAGPDRTDKGYETLQVFDDLIATVASTTTQTPQQNQINRQNQTNTGNGTLTQTNSNKPVGNFSVNSEYYLLEAEAVINEKPVLMQSILYRKAITAGAPNTDITIKTLSRKLVDPLKRV